MKHLDGKQFALKLLKRGRNKSAPPKLRLNNYRDENGRYQLSDGLQPWHERVVDYMISAPHAKIKDMAEAFGVSAVWMGQLIKTDAFLEYKAARMADHQNMVSSEIITKMQAVAVKSLEKLDEALENEPTFSQVRESADLVLKGLGYTAPSKGVNVAVTSPGDGNVNVVVDSTVVQRARTKWLETMNKDEAGVDENHYDYVTAARGAEIEDAVVIYDDDDETPEEIQGVQDGPLGADGEDT